VLVILALDKTQMTKLVGNQSAYPVYLRIGNISKTVHRKASMHATTIIGYLPVDKFSDVPEKALRTRLKGELVHWAMLSITEPLKQAGRTGVQMWCAEGYLRRVYPLLASFIGDWPEQNVRQHPRGPGPVSTKWECTSVASAWVKTLVAMVGQLTGHRLRHMHHA
jgi:hypothetical protein